MIVLDSTHTLQYVQAAAHTTVDGAGMVSYEDIPNGPTVGNDELPLCGTTPFNTNGSTIVTIVASPPKGFRRVIRSIFLNNTDTGAITPKFQIYDGTNTFVIFTGTRQTLEQLTYEHGFGWKGMSVALAAQ